MISFYKNGFQTITSRGQFYKQELKQKIYDQFLQKWFSDNNFQRSLFKTEFYFENYRIRTDIEQLNCVLQV